MAIFFGKIQKKKYEAMDGFPRNFDGKKYGPYRNQKCTYLGGSSEKKKIMGKTKKKSGKKKRRFFACDR